jgi:hypothetical protein
MKSRATAGSSIAKELTILKPDASRLQMTIEKTEAPPGSAIYLSAKICIVSSPKKRHPIRNEISVGHSPYQFSVVPWPSRTRVPARKVVPVAHCPAHHTTPLVWDSFWNSCVGFILLNQLGIKLAEYKPTNQTGNHFTIISATIISSQVATSHTLTQKRLSLMNNMAQRFAITREQIAHVCYQEIC